MEVANEQERLTEEDPRPPPILTNLNSTQPTRQQPAKRSAERRSTVEHTTAKQHLMPSVKERQVDNNASQDSTFEKTKQGSAYH
jgi:hypothetical protein